MFQKVTLTADRKTAHLYDESTTNQNIYRYKGQLFTLRGAIAVHRYSPLPPPLSAKTTFAERHTSGSPSTSIGLAPPPPPTHSIKEHPPRLHAPTALPPQALTLAAPTSSRAHH